MSNVSGELDTAGAFGLDDECDDCQWEPGGEQCSFHADEQNKAICGNCGGTGEAYMGRLASRPGPCRECRGSGEVAVEL